MRRFRGLEYGCQDPLPQSVERLYLSVCSHWSRARRHCPAAWPIRGSHAWFFWIEPIGDRVLGRISLVHASRPMRVVFSRTARDSWVFQGYQAPCLSLFLLLLREIVREVARTFVLAWCVKFINSRRRIVGAAGTTVCDCCQDGCCFRRQRKEFSTSYLPDYCCNFDITAASWPLVL